MYCDAVPAIAPPLNETVKYVSVGFFGWMAGVRNTSTAPNDGGNGGVVAVNVLGRLKVRRVQVLRSVCKEVEA